MDTDRTRLLAALSLCSYPIRPLRCDEQRPRNRRNVVSDASNTAKPFRGGIAIIFHNIRFEPVELSRVDRRHQADETVRHHACQHATVVAGSRKADGRFCRRHPCGNFRDGERLTLQRWYESMDLVWRVAVDGQHRNDERLDRFLRQG